MLIALDYDDTYTRDPLTWLTVVAFMKEKGHTFVCCTMRTPGEAHNIHPPLRSLMPIHCTSRQAKAEFLAKLNIFPDVWIDDNPRWLYMNAAPAEGNPLEEAGLGGEGDVQSL